MQCHGEPRAGNGQVGPPPLVKLAVLFVLVLCKCPSIGRHVLARGPPAGLELPLTHQTEIVAHDAAEPAAVCGKVQRRRLGVAAVECGNGAGRHDARVGEETDVFEELVDKVAAGLQRGDAVQDHVCAWLGARRERAQPCVQREEAKQPQVGARLGQQDGQGSNGRHGAIVDDAGGGYLCVVARGADEGEEALGKGRDGGRLCLQVRDNVQRVVEGREEGGEAAWRG